MSCRISRDWSATVRTMHGTVLSPRLRQAAKRRSPAMMRNRPLPETSTMMGLITPCSRMEEANSVRSPMVLRG